MAGLWLLLLFHASGILRVAYVQRYVHAQYVAFLQQLFEAYVCCAALVLLTQPLAIVVNYFHVERMHLGREVAADASQAEDPQRLAFRIVAQREGRVTAPSVLAERLDGWAEAAEAAED